MTRTSIGNTKLIEGFLRAQCYRHMATVENYTGLLRNFNGFVARYGCGASPTVSIVQDWLKERSLKWAAHIPYHRARLVERYLNWLEGQGVIAVNPFAELHRIYGPRTTPIVGALVSEDSAKALQRLRRIPRFGSFLGRVSAWRAMEAALDQHLARENGAVLGEAAVGGGNNLFDAESLRLGALAGGQRSRSMHLLER